MHQLTYPTNVASRNDTGPADQRSTNVRDDGAVQVGHDHHVKLARFGHELHRTETSALLRPNLEHHADHPDVRVIDDHVIELNSRRLVLLRDLAESVQEQAVTELHDVGLVHACNLLLTRYPSASGLNKSG